ncbi:hypothetical protein SSBR45G_07470 [Bradyrhizobium sp. SSBR45G]|nr:hypothetical protein SSBR45G_07470 [Bradyrhizobium sp. SSBR45G]GLH85076.1 hypothetical protein SSBR45R_25360 [Bradyrhizobium sp. SSBR45R]
MQMMMGRLRADRNAQGKGDAAGVVSRPIRPIRSLELAAGAAIGEAGAGVGQRVRAGRAGGIRADRTGSRRDVAAAGDMSSNGRVDHE